MILMWATSITRALEGVGPEIATSEANAIWVQKSRYFQGPPLPIARVKYLLASKSFSASAI
jgi:hypothetical protein